MNDTNAYPCSFESEKTNLKKIRRIEKFYFIFHENGSALTNRVTEDRPFLGKKKGAYGGYGSREEKFLQPGII